MYDDYDNTSRKNRQPKGKVARAECPACFNNVNVGNQPKVGHRVVCPSCKTELEVVWLSPIELDIPIDGVEVYDEDEDYEEDDYFDDEDY